MKQAYTTANAENTLTMDKLLETFRAMTMPRWEISYGSKERFEAFLENQPDIREALRPSILGTYFGIPCKSHEFIPEHIIMLIGPTSIILVYLDGSNRPETIMKFPSALKVEKER